jgi:hypothetical protein
MQGAKAPQACMTQTEATWGIVRTQQREPNLNGIYKYDTDNVGATNNVEAYIIDTGM